MTRKPLNQTHDIIVINSSSSDDNMQTTKKPSRQQQFRKVRTPVVYKELSSDDEDEMEHLSSPTKKVKVMESQSNNVISQPGYSVGNDVTTTSEDTESPQEFNLPLDDEDDENVELITEDDFNELGGLESGIIDENTTENVPTQQAIEEGIVFDEEFDYNSDDQTESISSQSENEGMSLLEQFLNTDFNDSDDDDYQCETDDDDSINSDELDEEDNGLFSDLTFDEHYSAEAISEKRLEKMISIITQSITSENPIQPVGIRVSNKKKTKHDPRQLLYFSNDVTNPLQLVNRFKTNFYMWIDMSAIKKAYVTYYNRIVRPFSKKVSSEKLPYIDPAYAKMMDERVIYSKYYVIDDYNDEDDDEIDAEIDLIHRNEKREYQAKERSKRLTLPFGSSIIKNQKEIEALLPEWINQFKTQYPNLKREDVNYLIDAEERLKHLHTGITDTAAEQYEYTPKLRNSSARQVLAACIRKFRLRNPTFFDDNNLVLSKGSEIVNVISLQNMFPQIQELINSGYRTAGSDHLARLKQWGKNSSEDLLLRGLQTFLNYALFYKNVYYKDLFQYLADNQLIRSYSNDLTELLRYRNVETIRKKIEAVGTSIYIRLKPVDSTHFIDYSDPLIVSLQVSKDIIYKNPYYSKKARSEHIFVSHSANVMKDNGQFMSVDQFWSCYAKSIDICTRWVYLWFCVNISMKEKKKIIRQHGQQFNCSFLYWFSLYTFAGRRQLYLQSILDDLVLTTNKNYSGQTYQQWLFVVGYGDRDTYRVIEKVKRDLKMTNYSLGIANNLVIYFYKYVFVPHFITKSLRLKGNNPTEYKYKRLPLFFSKRGNGLIYQLADRNKIYTEMLKEFSLTFGGTKLTNQLLRTHYNSYCMQLNLNEREKALLHAGMNHSAHTANQHYIIFNSVMAVNDGNVILRGLDTQAREEVLLRQAKNDLNSVCLTLSEVKLLLDYANYLVVNRNVSEN